MEDKLPKIIAVDFDGTLCEDRYPEIGNPRLAVFEYLFHEKNVRGAKIILWTCRVNEHLKHATAWCAEHGLYFDAVNTNLPEVIRTYGCDTRKIYADEYIDDKNRMIGGKG
ncbi:MAG: hypothetical protein LUE29_09660 [Lachnospiraceae bacterium]|nr:hypothetical protein [Lachnospiraceae bacterium]